MIYRKSLKIPMTKSCKVADFLIQEREFHYRLDIFFAKNWRNKKKKPIVLHFTGAAMKGPYTVDSPMVKQWIKQDFIFCCVYYYHHRFQDLTWSTQDKRTSRFPVAPFTQPPYWCENFSRGHDYHHHLRGRAYMIQSALEYLVDHGVEFKFAKLDIDKIFFTSKSRGGISTVVWSALSNCQEWQKYQHFCKGIVNSNGFVGSDLLYDQKAGWRNFKNSMQVLSYYIAHTQHIFYHAYNEKDVGNNDISRRLIYSIPKKILKNHYFTNFTQLGHVTHIEYNIAVVKAMLNNDKCYIEDKQIKDIAEIFQEIEK